MTETTNNLPAITQDVVKQKISIELTKATISIQAMQDEADALVVNDEPENLTKVAEFLAKVKKSEGIIDKTHEAGKKPFLEGGRIWDAAKKDLLAATGAVKNPIQAKYTAVCNEIDRKNREAEQKRQAEKQILEGIESNVMSFSQQIAACTTKAELTGVERLINLEKSPNRASKYGDHHQKAITRYDEVLLPILKDQKTKIEEKERIEAELKNATDPEKHDELTQQLEAKENEIVQNQVKVQEQALLQEQPGVQEVEVVVPTIKTKRTDIVCEVVDVALVFKKTPALLNIELKTIDAKKQGQLLKDAGAFGDKDELTVNGIKYTIKKSW
jgi:hypothetical protein